MRDLPLPTLPIFDLSRSTVSRRAATPGEQAVRMSVAAPVQRWAGVAIGSMIGRMIRPGRVTMLLQDDLKRV